MARAARGMGGGQEGKDEGVGVPKHVAPVARPRQAAGADGRLSGVSDRRHHVEERKADRQLQLVVPLDDHVCVLPPAGPCLTMPCEKSIESRSAGPVERTDGLIGIRKVDRVGLVSAEAIERGVPSSDLCGGSHDPAARTGDPDPRGRFLIDRSRSTRSVTGAITEVRSGIPWDKSLSAPRYSVRPVKRTSHFGMCRIRNRSVREVRRCASRGQRLCGTPARTPANSNTFGPARRWLSAPSPSYTPATMTHGCRPGAGAREEPLVPM